MNTLKTIYDKLGDKTELAKHEVKLALVDDLIKLVSKGDTDIKNAFDLRSKGKDLIRQSISNEKLGVEVYSQGLQLGKIILTKMKELGIQDPIVNEKIKYFETKISSSKDRLKFIEKAITTFN